MVALGATLTLIAVAGCSGDDGGEAVAVADSEPGAVVEVESVDSLAEVLSSLGGPTVDDTEIRYTDGTATLSIGGLQLEMPALRELDYYHTSDTNITVPPSWPTLDLEQLNSHVDPAGNPTIGLAVFAQTTLVTDDDARRRLIDGYYTMTGFAEAEVVHDSATLDVTTGITCWAQIRFGRSRPGFDDSHEAVAMFAGPRVASSAMIISGPASFTDTPAIVGDLVESTCGTRPDDL